MSRSLKTPQDSVGATNQSCHSRSSCVPVSSFLIMVVVLCAGLYEVVSNSRYKIVGTTDPTSGYRIEYTVSSQYSKNELRTLDALGSTYNSFNPKPPPLVLQWIWTHLLRKPNQFSNPTSSGFESGGIIQYRQQNGDRTQLKIDQNGYPDWPYLDRRATDLMGVHAQAG